MYSLSLSLSSALCARYCQRLQKEVQARTLGSPLQVPDTLEHLLPCLLSRWPGIQQPTQQLAWEYARQLEGSNTAVKEKHKQEGALQVTDLAGIVSRLCTGHPQQMMFGLHTILRHMRAVPAHQHAGR